MVMRTSQAGQARIKGFEAEGGVPRLKAYLDDAGIPTIFWGTTRYPNGQRVQPGDTGTPVKAQICFLNDLTPIEDAINGNVKVPLTQNQFDALVSFTYEEGIGAEEHSTLLGLLNRGDYKGAAAQFLVWDKEHRGGQLVVDQGILNRRKAEMAVFLTGMS